MTNNEVANEENNDLKKVPEETNIDNRDSVSDETKESDNNNKESETEENSKDLEDVEMIKCPRCGQDTPKSVRLCMFCGYNIVEKPYIPMDKKKSRIIKWAIGIPLVIIFFIWYFIFRN